MSVKELMNEIGINAVKASETIKNLSTEKKNALLIKIANCIKEDKQKKIFGNLGDRQC